MLSIIIPTWQAAAELPATLACLDGGCEIVISDGGSTDGTPDIATAAGLRVIDGPRGRGAQLAVGARSATGDWFLFLHADTRLGSGWREHVEAFAADPRNSGHAAVFRFALDDGSPAARRLERLVAWRTRVLGLSYGDQGLLMSRAFYNEIGGFSALPLMEDVDMVRRIGRRRLTVLDIAAVTSAARFRESGYLRRSLRNLFCLGLYLLGVAPQRIERIYR